MKRVSTIIFLLLTGYSMAGVETAKLFVNASFTNNSTFILNGITLWNKSEVPSGTKLFSENNPLKERIPPFIKNIHFVLKKQNKVKVKFTSGKKENGRYTIIFKRAESIKPQLIVSMEELNKELKFNFSIGDKANVKTRVIGKEVSYISFINHHYTQVFHGKKGYMSFGGTGSTIDLSGIISKKGLKGIAVKFQQPKGKQVHIIFSIKGKEQVYKFKSPTDEIQTIKFNEI